jgi:hypothetical protein
MNSVSNRTLAGSVISRSLHKHSIDVVFHAITTAWLRKWMHAEPISELLVNKNVPGEDRVKTFEDWVGYTHSNAIVSPVFPPTTVALMQNITR